MRVVILSLFLLAALIGSLLRPAAPSPTRALAAPSLTPAAAIQSNWKKVETNLFVRLTGLHFLDDQRGWVVGTTGTVMVTADGGANWKRKPLRPTEREEKLHDVWAFAEDDITVLGEYSYHAKNPTDMIFNRTFLLMSKNPFVNDLEHGWHIAWADRQLNPARRKPRAKAPGVDARTDNEIDDEEVDRVTDPVFVRFHFTDDKVGWMIGETGAVQRTASGGYLWKMQYPGPRKLLYDVYAVNKNQAWVVGAAGTVIRTMDAGESWQDVRVPTTQTLRAVHFAGEQNGWAVGTRGTILRASSTGRRDKDGDLAITWESIPSPTTETLNDVFFVSPNEGWICGEHATLLHSTDGGRTWQEALGSTSVRPFVSFNRLFFLNATTGWAIGSNGNIYSYSTKPSGTRPVVSRDPADIK